MVPQELIDKYFRNECNSEEQKLVLEYFRDHPEAWNKYMTEEDWDKFQVNTVFDPALSKRLYETVSRNTFKKRSRKKTAWLAAAASLALLIGSIWYFQGREHAPAANGLTYSGTDLQLVETRNTSGRPMNIELENGSTVVLMPNSGIRYHDPFVTDNKREVYLSGEALFKVAADKARPFIVYSGDIATTVLGTSFTIKAFDESSTIKVALHKGKVQVTAADAIRVKWKTDMILLPGDELTYNKHTMLASIKRNSPIEGMVKAGNDLNRTRTVQRPDWYTFDASPLADVFDQLSSYYQVDIYYYPEDIRNKYFSGRMDKSDSLESILHDISLLNQLQIERTNKAYIIKRKK
jgi:ferric-dicitrate binding protein FerR (iron transport regulator)